MLTEVFSSVFTEERYWTLTSIALQEHIEYRFSMEITQRVAIQGALSEWKSVLSGVPQGSVLGPLLFVLYINCLPNQLQHCSSVHLFADDRKPFKDIQTVEDCQHLQMDINHFVSWTEDSF